MSKEINYKKRIEIRVERFEGEIRELRDELKVPTAIHIERAKQTRMDIVRTQVALLKQLLIE